MMARLRLTTKQVNGGYYKGNRTGSTGYFGGKNHSSYIVDYAKTRFYVPPRDLDGFKVCFIDKNKNGIGHMLTWT